MDIAGLIGKVRNYENIRNNTIAYREAWDTQIKPMLHEQLKKIIDETGLKATVVEKTEMDNLEAVVLDMGQEDSGIAQRVTDNLNKRLIRYNGMLVYQQLFNGKIIIMIVPPFIEGLGQPKPPFNLEILRPEELKSPFLLRHVEKLLKELTDWEDYDDDVPEKKSIGFQMGFKNNEVLRETAATKRRK
ncbi:MAG: hypothetical protein AAF573_07535 [Bacteroidota bacterium]